MNASRRIAVVGGGVAGLACARRLLELGHRVTVFDKARSPGGRVATRRGDTGSFDHGAQFFTVRSPEFRTLVESARVAEAVAPWDARFVTISSTGAVTETRRRERFVGLPSMSALSRFLAEGLGVRTGFRVVGIDGERGQWTVDGEGGEAEGPFDRLVISLPAEQATALVPASSPLHVLAGSIRMSPCVALMVGFAERVPTGFDAAFIEGSPLAWAARDSSKPGRASGERWVLHASGAWSTRHVDQGDERLTRALLEAFREAAACRLPQVVVDTVHRWRFATPDTTTADRAPADLDRGLVLAGDWCAGPRVEGAWLSGTAAALLA